MATEGTMTSIFRDRVELPSLEVQAGRAAPQALGVTPLIVGTHPECDVVVADARVSRRHCRISLHPRGVLVEDLASKNGTTLQGVEVERAWVPLGIPILIGDTRVVVSPLGGTVDVALSVGTSFGDAVGASLPMRAIFARLERAAPADATILLLGESGTGKEVLAHAIHSASPRRDGPFVPFDCGAVPPGLIEAELFGHVRGAFTGASSAHKGLLATADGGTLFLDEIGELPRELQPKLLRALETRQFRPVGAQSYVSFDARIVAATHRPLRQDVATGLFRDDLFYRLAVVEVRVPPLRERADDIELLVERFLASQSPPRSIRELSAGTLAMLRGHDWPGNVRELRNVVSRLLLFPELATSALDFGPTAPDPTPLEQGSRPRSGLPVHLPLREAREQVVLAFEREYIIQKLKETDGNVSRAADAMGVSRQFLHRLMERYDLRRTDAKSPDRKA